MRAFPSNVPVVRAALLAAAGVLVFARAGAAEDPRKPDTPPPCTEAIKGRVVSVDPSGSSVTLERQGKTEKRPVAPSAAAALKGLKPGAQATLQLNCRSNPPVVTGYTLVAQAQPTPGGARTTEKTDERTTTKVLLATDDACKLTVDFKPWAELKAGDRTELKLSSGDEHQLEATTADGRTWKEKVKASGGQMIVEIKFGKPVATVAEYDALAARVCADASALKVAGYELDVILRNKKFKFDQADSAAVSAAATSWTRDLALLKDMVAPASRTQATADVSALDATVTEYAALLVKALQTAQEKYTILGEAGVLRDKAQGLRAHLQVAPATAQLIPACAAVAR